MGRKSSHIAGLLAGLSILAWSHLTAQERSFESVNPHLKAPIWVSVAEGVDPRSGLKADLFDVVGARLAESHVKRVPTQEDARTTSAEPACSSAHTTQIYSDRLEPKPNRNLGELLKYAGAIYSGRIERVEGGFLLGQPGSLLHIRIDHPYRDSAVSLRRLHIDVFYPYLQVRIGEYVVCRSDARFSAVPHPDDRAMIFEYGKPLDKTGTLIAPEPSEIFIENAGELVIPRALRRKLGLDDGAQFVELERLVEQGLAPEDRRPTKDRP